MRSTNKLRLVLIILILILSACELVDTKITPAEPPPTTDVRYVVQMSSSSASAGPNISYTNSAGGTTQLNELSLDLTVPIDSGTTASLSALCNGFYSSVTGNASAAVDIKIFISDSLVADSSVIMTDDLNAVFASALINVKVN